MARPRAAPTPPQSPCHEPGKHPRGTSTPGRWRGAHLHRLLQAERALTPQDLRRHVPVVSQLCRVLLPAVTCAGPRATVTARSPSTVRVPPPPAWAGGWGTGARAPRLTPAAPSLPLGEAPECHRFQGTRAPSLGGAWTWHLQPGRGTWGHEGGCGPTSQHAPGWVGWVSWGLLPALTSAAGTEPPRTTRSGTGEAWPQLTQCPSPLQLPTTLPHPPRGLWAQPGDTAGHLHAPIPTAPTPRGRAGPLHTRAVALSPKSPEAVTASPMSLSLLPQPLLPPGAGGPRAMPSARWHRAETSGSPPGRGWQGRDRRTAGQTDGPAPAGDTRPRR